MKVPPGYTEAQVLEAIETAVSILAPSFVFGHYEIEDIKQYGYQVAIEKLAEGKFDCQRPLPNFLYTCIRNKFINLKRDEYRRTDPPCTACHSGQPCEKADGNSCCRKYYLWHTRNKNKSGIANPIGLEQTFDDRPSSSTAEEDVQISEMLERIDLELPIELRATYLQMRANVHVPKAKRLQVEKAISEIFKGAIGCPSVDD